MTAQPEVTLPAAVRALDTATSAMVDPRPERHDRGTSWLDSVYTELRSAIHGHRAGGANHRTAEPQPPLWIDGVDLCREIDSTVKQWEPNAAGHHTPTVNRLHTLSGRKWRPQDVDTVTGYANDLRRWVQHYRTLVDQKPLTLPNPCPKCGAWFAHRSLDGERVRVAALQLTLERCVCNACRVEWPADRFPWLARLLGYEPLAGVTW